MDVLLLILLIIFYVPLVKVIRGLEKKAELFAEEQTQKDALHRQRYYEELMEERNGR
jgi:hypothetical protein